MNKSLFDRACALSRRDCVAAAALALVPLACHAAASAGPGAGVVEPGIDINSVIIGEQYGGQFIENTQYQWSWVRTADGAEVCIGLGPISGANPFAEDPAPKFPPSFINPTIRVEGFVNRVIPAGSTLRISYAFRINTTAPLNVSFLDFFASSFEDFVFVSDNGPGAIVSGELVTGSIETGQFSVASAEGAFFTFTTFFSWGEFGPDDTFSWDWCDAEFLRIELITPPGGGNCPGDANGDNTINFSDINTILSFFGALYAPASGPGDTDGNGAVNFGDIAFTLSGFGTVCQP